jgi:tetratricopeptide (TPR) repeat protein
MACVLAAVTVSYASDAQWLDVEGQIQYGFYTEDLRALGNLAARLDSKDGAEPLQSYYAGLAYYRLAQTDAAHDRPRTAQALDRCIANLDAALQARPEWADALALQGACLGYLAQFKSLRAPLAGPHSRSQLAHALQVEPHNPRSLLLDGTLEYERAGSPGSAAKAHACAQFAAAVARFEAARPEEEHVPEWGTAEGYTSSARCHLEHGDPAAARDALERALLIAPDYQLARRLMARITAG